MHSSKSTKWLLGGVFALTLIGQLTLTANTAFLDTDDWFIVRMGRDVVDASPANLKEPLLRFWTEEPTWRPLSVLLSGLEHAVLGDNPCYRVAFHGILHLACGWMIFLLATRWFQSTTAGVWSAILYTAHPIHGETLAWFHSGFEAIPITLLILTTLWLYTTKRQTWLVLLMFQAALFVRENALCIPFLITAIAASRTSSAPRWRHALRASSPYWVLLILNAVGRGIVLANTVQRDDSMLQSFHITSDLWSSLVHVFAQPWFPVHPDIGWATAWFVLFALLAVAMVWLHWRYGNRQLLATVGGFFILACVPIVLQVHDSTIFQDMPAQDHDQRWYFFHLPIAALMIWPAILLTQRPRWGTPVLVTITLLFLLLQGLHMHWWTERGRLVTSMETTVDTVRMETTDTAIGVILTSRSASADLAEQVMLNSNIRINRPPQDNTVFRIIRQNGAPSIDRAMATVNSHGELLWRSAPQSPPKKIQWWKWSEGNQKLLPMDVVRGAWPDLPQTNDPTISTH